MIPLRAWIIPFLAAVILIAAGIKARADDSPPINVRHQRPGKITCKIIRDFVAVVGEVEAEKMARASGASDARIEAARKCLK